MRGGDLALSGLSRRTGDGLAPSKGTDQQIRRRLPRGKGQGAERSGRFGPRPSIRGRYIRRSTSIFLISAIAAAGFRPLGQACVQFMIVWQR